jgi:hypothetical protein
MVVFHDLKKKIEIQNLLCHPPRLTASEENTK